MLTVACVYASKPGILEAGPCDPRDYSAARVYDLRRAFARHLTVPHQFAVLTDDPHIPNAVPLMHNWGGWWSKLELFAWPWADPVLYCDLDNIVLGSLDELAKPRSGFWMARDWDYPVPNSSLMYWRGDYSFLYRKFRERPQGYAKMYDKMPELGDQGFIAAELCRAGMAPQIWHLDLPDGFLKSRHDLASLGDGRMVLWHGSPKPWDLTPPLKHAM